MKQLFDTGIFWRQLPATIAAAAFIGAMAAPAFGAEFLTRAGKPLSGTTASEVFVRGEIVPGDARALAAFLRSARRVGSMTIDSPGGDVIEAIRMGEIVRASAISTKVAPGGQCSSACLFVWMAGATRIATSSVDNAHLGRVGLHRPFLRAPENTEASLAAQANVVRGVTAYLDSKLMPRRLIDLMMSRPSNDVYWLASRDLDELGVNPPEVEELYIFKCKFDRRRNAQLVDALDRKDTRAADEITATMDKVNDCIADLTIEARAAALRKLNTGWLPANPFQQSKN
jgi:hypothetical protein